MSRKKTKKKHYFITTWDYKTNKWKKEKVEYEDYDYSEGRYRGSYQEVDYGSYSDYYKGKGKTGGGTGWHKGYGGYGDYYKGGGGYYGGYDYSYGKSGAGYYHYEPPLSISYIEQLASGLASQNAVTIEAGDNWSTDIDERRIIYDPEMLQRASRSLIIACLLHEIGHITHTTPARKLKGIFFPKYKGAHTVINTFEDLRIDKLVEQEQAGAEDIEQENKEAVKAHADYTMALAGQEREKKREFAAFVLGHCEK